MANHYFVTNTDCRFLVCAEKDCVIHENDNDDFVVGVAGQDPTACYTVPGNIEAEDGSKPKGWAQAVEIDCEKGWTNKPPLG